MQGPRRGRSTVEQTCVADAGVMDLDAHFVGPGRRDLNILIAELLTGAPGDGRLAGDGLSR